MIRTENGEPTEDLNNSNEIIFVSPNTKIFDLEEFNLIQSLSDKILEKEVESKTEREFFNSEAEIFRSENLLIDIIDFENDLEKFSKEIRSISNIDLFTDCFFFSSSKINKSTKIDYVIADFDNVNINSPVDQTSLQNSNLSEFLGSYSEFICNYFEVSEKRDYYIEFLTGKINHL